MGLLNEMNQYCAQQPKRAKGAGRQLFIAQKEEIQEVINAGYPMTEVWQYLHENGRMPIVYRVFVEYVHRFITNPQKTEKEKWVTAKNKGGEDNTTLAARLEKPSSANANISTSESAIATTVKQTDTRNTMAQAQREPRGIGNIPKPKDFSAAIDMTGKFEIDESYITQTTKFYNNDKPDKESLI